MSENNFGRKLMEAINSKQGREEVQGTKETKKGGKEGLEKAERLSDEIYNQIKEIVQGQDTLREKWAEVATAFLEEHKDDSNFHQIVTEFSLQLAESNSDKSIMGFKFAELLENLIKRNS